jgi:hypothetical protein
MDRLTLCGILALGFGAERLRPFFRLSSERFMGLLPPRSVRVDDIPAAIACAAVDCAAPDIAVALVPAELAERRYGPLQLGVERLDLGAGYVQEHDRALLAGGVLHRERARQALP